VFYRELYAKQLPKVELTAGAPLLSPEAMQAVAARQFPGLEFPYIFYPERAGEAVSLMANNEKDDSHRWLYVYLHPQTGALVGDTIHAEPFLDWVYRFHIYLLFGDSGYTVNGLHAFVLSALSVTGLIIWWPGRRVWKRGLKVNVRARWKRVNYDLHSAVGFYAALCLFLVAMTGAYFRFQEPFVRAVEWMTGTKSERSAPEMRVPSRQAGEPGGGPMALSRAVEAALAEFPDGSLSAIYLPMKPGDVLRVRIKREADGMEYGANEVSFHPATGEVLRVSRYAERTAADEVLRWFGMIHFGTFGGLATRILWVLLGIVPGVLAISGFLMWWNRVVVKRLARQVEPDYAGVEEEAA
jgi:uncharacterized iron-regulated membrane protein